MLFDTHIHTKFSPDSNMKLSEILEASKEKKLGIIITEHLDLDVQAFINPNWSLDIENYLSKYSPFRNDSFLLGIEIGLNDNKFSENMMIFEKYKNKLDFIIGSIHTMNGKDIYTTLLTETRDKQKVYSDYLKYMNKKITDYSMFNTLAHIDYICRYAPFEDPEIYYKDFADYFDTIFKNLINNNKCLELNTARLNDKNALDNMINIYSRFKELGGEFITLGSDSHTQTQIGRNFQEAKYLLEKTGLKPVYFKNRIMQI